MVASEPFISDEQVRQQKALRAMLLQRYPSTLVSYVDLGNLLNLRDPQIAFDGMHLTALGGSKVAEALETSVLQSLSLPGLAVSSR